MLRKILRKFENILFEIETSISKISQNIFLNQKKVINKNIFFTIILQFASIYIKSYFKIRKYCERDILLKI